MPFSVSWYINIIVNTKIPYHLDRTIWKNRWFRSRWCGCLCLRRTLGRNNERRPHRVDGETTSGTKSRELYRESPQYSFQQVLTELSEKKCHVKKTNLSISLLVINLEVDWINRFFIVWLKYYFKTDLWLVSCLIYWIHSSFMR